MQLISVGWWVDWPSVDGGLKKSQRDTTYYSVSPVYSIEKSVSKNVVFDFILVLLYRTSDWFLRFNVQRERVGQSKPLVRNGWQLIFH